jgi:hypothetical protein
MSTRLITNAAEIILPDNALRKSFVIQNEDGALNMYIKKESGTSLTVSATDHDHRIGPGSGISLNSVMDGENDIRARYTIISDAGNPRVSFFETESIRR